MAPAPECLQVHVPSRRYFRQWQAGRQLCRQGRSGDYDGVALIPITQSPARLQGDWGFVVGRFSSGESQEQQRPRGAPHSRHVLRNWAAGALLHA